MEKAGMAFGSNPRVVGMDASHWEVFQALDASSPSVTYISPPTPLDNSTIRINRNASIRVQYYDNESACTNATLFWKNSTESAWHGQSMTNVSFWNGSYNNYFEANFTESSPTTVTYYVNCTNAANLTTMAPPRAVAFAENVSPTAPYTLYGRAFLYNGSIAVGYRPIARPGASVIAQTVNATGALLTYGPQNTDPAGNYAFTVQPKDELVWGNHVFVQASDAAGWRGWNQTSIVMNSDKADCNVTYGVPYNVTVTWVPDWTVTPILGVNELAPGTLFNVQAEVRDNRSLVCPGYYGQLRIWTNDTHPSVALWGGGNPTTVALDGVGGASSPFNPGDDPLGGSDGYYNRTVQLYYAIWHPWVVWVNDTWNGDDSLIDPAIWLAPYAAATVADNTHVRILAGGLMWQLSAGWNIVAMTKDFAATGMGAFTASVACQRIQDANTIYGTPASVIVMASLMNGQPSTISYDTYTYGVGGVDFPIGNDHAYWVYVDAAIPRVFIPGNEVTLPNDPDVGIVAGVNTVVLNNGWTMVSTGMNEASAIFGWGATAPLLADPVGNQGNGFQGSIFWTGGSWQAGVHYAWYDQPADLRHQPDSNAGVDYLTGGATLSSAAVWLPATQTFDTCVYDDWFGLWNEGLGYNNEAMRIYYASGFWVYSGGGTITYDVTV